MNNTSIMLSGCIMFTYEYDKYIQERISRILCALGTYNLDICIFYVRKKYIATPFNIIIIVLFSS